jgi:TRAP transporter 4TM/12TM fusion protein
VGVGAEDDPDRPVGDRPGDGDRRPARPDEDGDRRPARPDEDGDRGPVRLGEDQVRIRLEEAEQVDVDALIAEHDADRPARRLGGPIAIAVAVVAGVLSAWVLVSVFRPRVELQYRMTFLAVVLPLTFLVYRPGFRRRSVRLTERSHDNPGIADWVLAAASVVVCVYPVLDFDEFVVRGPAATDTDVVMGLLLVALVLEAARRTIGWVFPAICVAFLLYAYYGAYLPVDWVIGHKGYGATRLAQQMYMGTEGIFGVALDVAATYIVLFTIYGAVLELSGAGKFFVDVSFAAFRRSRTAPGRTVTLAGFLLGTVSGSGTATAVTLGSVAWPVLKKAGYPRNQAGGVLAASGIGAILSPPTLGAAAFIIAEFLRVSYLEVLIYATVPTLLYYLGIFLAIEMDARRFGTRAVDVDLPSAWKLLARFGYHFSSLFVIILLLALEFSVFRSVAYATALAFLLSFLHKPDRMTPRRIGQALSKGALGVLPVAATCAAAGVIVGVTTLTGLGLGLAGMIVDGAGAVSDNATVTLTLTAVFSAVAITILGLAVPVTASFIIAAIVVGPAMQSLGVSGPETYMFVFYYSVLAEVSPPTALAAVASAAITGGDAFRTMIATWKYTLPAFLVPFAFVLAPAGEGLIGQAPFGEIVLVALVSALAVAALAVVTGRWMFGPAGPVERALCLVAAVLLLYLSTGPVLAGLAALAVAVAAHLLRLRAGRRGTGPAPPAAAETAPASSSSEGKS